MTEIIIPMDILTPSNIMFALGIIGMIFTIWGKVTKPQIDSEKKDALLAQQVQWNIEANERRFSEMQNSIKDAFLLAQNHTHTVDVKVDELIKQVNLMDKGLGNLSTIINERIPKGSPNLTPPGV